MPFERSFSLSRLIESSTKGSILTSLGIGYSLFLSRSINSVFSDEDREEDLFFFFSLLDHCLKVAPKSLFRLEISMEGVRNGFEDIPTCGVEGNISLTSSFMVIFEIEGDKGSLEELIKDEVEGEFNLLRAFGDSFVES